MRIWTTLTGREHIMYYSPWHCKCTSTLQISERGVPSDDILWGYKLFPENKKKMFAESFELGWPLTTHGWFCVRWKWKEWNVSMFRQCSPIVTTGILVFYFTSSDFFLAAFSFAYNQDIPVISKNNIISNMVHWHSYGQLGLGLTFSTKGSNCFCSANIFRSSIIKGR